MWSLLRRAVGAREVPRAVDQHHMRRRLRRVAELPVSVGIVFLSEQLEIVAEPSKRWNKVCASACRPLRLVVVRHQNVHAKTLRIDADELISDD